jgi:hypothetical protein
VWSRWSAHSRNGGREVKRKEEVTAGSGGARMKRRSGPRGGAMKWVTWATTSEPLARGDGKERRRWVARR